MDLLIDFVLFVFHNGIRKLWLTWHILFSVLNFCCCKRKVMSNFAACFHVEFVYESVLHDAVFTVNAFLLAFFAPLNTSVKLNVKCYVFILVLIHW